MAEYTEQIAVNHLVNGTTGEVEIHTWTTVLRDGVPHSRTKHVEVLAPGAELGKCSEATCKIATAAWTPEKVAAWDEKFAAQVAASRANREAEAAAIEAEKAELERKQADLRAKHAEVLQAKERLRAEMA